MLSIVSCTEMMELQTGVARYAERRREMIVPKYERRKDSGVGHRAVQARVAYLVMVHRRNCLVCRSDG
jgi:hypothetical protein